ncbi:MAG: HAD-IB family phosphatase [Dehalococcoidales bacterium]|nr:HAD-IB family phosphatase [Dehalococcoidales bacterium]
MKKTAIQLDFDGTVTEEDVSLLLLDEFAGSRWRKYLEEYASGKISVGAFSTKVFGMIKADEKTLTHYVLNSPRVKVRPGLREFIDYCKNRRIKVLIVSHGLTFYIKAILIKLGIKGLEIHAAENVFSPDGIKVRYLGPDGRELEAGFKEAYMDILKQEGYQVVYIGDGNSDIYPSRKAQYVCATAKLLQRCRAEKLKCYPFSDFYGIIKIIDSLKVN